MKTTIRYINWADERGEPLDVEYDGRPEFKFDHLWINGPDKFKNVAVFDDDRWWVFNEDDNEIIAVATDVIIISMEEEK